MPKTRPRIDLPSGPSTVKQAVFDENEGAQGPCGYRVGMMFDDGLTPGPCVACSPPSPLARHSSSVTSTPPRPSPTRPCSSTLPRLSRSRPPRDWPRATRPAPAAGRRRPSGASGAAGVRGGRKAAINEFIDKRVYFGGQFIQFILKGHSLLKINKLYLIYGGGPVLYSSLSHGPTLVSILHSILYLFIHSILYSTLYSILCSILYSILYSVLLALRPRHAQL